MALAAEPLAAAAKKACAQQAYPLFRDYLAAVRQLEETGAWAAACRDDLLFPLTRRMADVCTTLEQQYRARIVRDHDSADVNGILCAAEVHYFRHYVEPALKDIAAALPDSEHTVRVAREQTADLLHLIVLDHIWANEREMAEELAAEAVALAAETRVEVRIRAALADYLPPREEPLARNLDARAADTFDVPAEPDEPPPARSPKPIPSRPGRIFESFPAKLPFASDRWRLGAAVMVLAVLVLACLAGSDGSLSTPTPSSRLSSPPPPTKPPTANAPPNAMAATKTKAVNAADAAGIEDDPVKLKLRILLTQIHAEEHTAQQIERQLTLPHHGSKSFKDGE